MFFGKIDIKGCCVTTSKSTVNLGGGKYCSGTQRDHFRLCLEFSKLEYEYKWREQLAFHADLGPDRLAKDNIFDTNVYTQQKVVDSPKL